jgi:predicted XRE-type DNA-binding protein
MVGASLSIAKRIVELEKEAEGINDAIYALERKVEANPEHPSLDAIKKEADEVFSELALDSVEFANIMRKAITDMYVLPYRLVDGGHVQPRVIFSVALASFLPDKHADLPLLRVDGAVDLMKQPVRVRIRREVVAMVDKGMKQAEIATELGVTKTEVANAMALHRCMIANGVEDPWIPMTSVDEVRDYFKRVRNSRFEFKPLDGFEVTKHPHD